MKYFLTSTEGNNLLIENASGSAQVNIAKREDIQSIPLALPSVNQQIQVANMLSVCDNKIVLLQKNNTLLEELKYVLLSKLATVEN